MDIDASVVDAKEELKVKEKEEKPYGECQKS